MIAVYIPFSGGVPIAIDKAMDRGNEIIPTTIPENKFDFILYLFFKFL